jgi:hypothetical protein
LRAYEATANACVGVNFALTKIRCVGPGRLEADAGTADGAWETGGGLI